MCVHERTLQRHFWRKHFMDAIPVRKTQIKLSCMFVCVNEHITVVPLMPPSASKPHFQHRICFTNTKLSMYFFHVQSVTIKHYAINLEYCIKCACKSFRIAAYKWLHVLNEKCTDHMTMKCPILKSGLTQYFCTSKMKCCSFLLLIFRHKHLETSAQTNQ